MASPAEKPKAADGEITLYLEAHPKAVRRALRAEPNPGDLKADFTDVEVRRSDPKLGEHGNTTVIFKHPYDDTTMLVFRQRLIDRANIEHERMFGDNDDDEDQA